MERRAVLGAFAVALALPLLLAACGGSSARDATAEPAVVEHVAGTDIYRITLSREAARRLDVRTAAVTRSGGRTVIPYSAVFYSSTGKTWAYVNTESLTFVRQPIVVDRIDRHEAILREGPAAGTKVATVGVQELHGIESAAGGSR
jgi:hypothetical protein